MLLPDMFIKVLYPPLNYLKAISNYNRSVNESLQFSCESSDKEEVIREIWKFNANLFFKIRKFYLETYTPIVISSLNKSLHEEYMEIYREHEILRKTVRHNTVKLQETKIPFRTLEVDNIPPYYSSMLDNDLSNILNLGGIIAGSYPLRLLKGTHNSDIDVFFTKKEDFWNVFKFLVGKTGTCKVYKNSIKLSVGYATYNLIARIYNNKSEVIYGFDLPMSQIMLDKEGDEWVVKYTRLFKYVSDTGYMEVDGSRLSPTYFQRLNKYWKRGLVHTIYFPEFELLKKEMLHFPLYHPIWCLLNGKGRRNEGYAKPRHYSDYEKPYEWLDVYRYRFDVYPISENKVIEKSTRKVQTVKTLYKIEDEGKEYTIAIPRFESNVSTSQVEYTNIDDMVSKCSEFLEFLEDNPGEQVNSTIFPTPITSSDQWKEWLENEKKSILN